MKTRAGRYEIQQCYINSDWRPLERWSELGEAVLIAAGYSTLPKKYGMVRVIDRKEHKVVTLFPSGIRTNLSAVNRLGDYSA